jgi:uncharacterized protein
LRRRQGLSRRQRSNQEKVRPMILIDTGPWSHSSIPKTLSTNAAELFFAACRRRMVTTIPVLTEAFCMLKPRSRESNALRDFVARGGLRVGSLTKLVLLAFELMEMYADHPMDLADASLIVAAETMETRGIFTIDRRDFSTYHIRRGHRLYPFEIFP